MSMYFFRILNKKFNRQIIRLPIVSLLCQPFVLKMVKKYLRVPNSYAFALRQPPPLNMINICDHRSFLRHESDCSKKRNYYIKDLSIGKSCREVDRRKRISQKIVFWLIAKFKGSLVVV